MTKEEYESLIEEYYDSDHDIYLEQARVLAKRFGVKLPIIHIDKCAEFVEGRRRGPQVSLAIKKIDPELGVLFTIGDVYKRGERRGRKRYPGVYHTFYSPIRRQVDCVNEQGKRTTCMWVRFQHGEAERII